MYSKAVFVRPVIAYCKKIPRTHKFESKLAQTQHFGYIIEVFGHFFDSMAPKHFPTLFYVRGLCILFKIKTDP